MMSNVTVALIFYALDNSSHAYLKFNFQKVGKCLQARNRLRAEITKDYSPSPITATTTDTLSKAISECVHNCSNYIIISSYTVHMPKIDLWICSIVEPPNKGHFEADINLSD